jgi:alpha-ketoglutaric semialdehyde dehydrogenase
MTPAGQSFDSDETGAHVELALELKPVSLIGFGDGTEGASFTGMNPATGQPLEPKFFSAGAEDLDRAAALAQSAFPVYSHLSGKDKGAFLRRIAAAIEAGARAIIQRAHLETALPEARLQGELARTCNQLRLFAEVVEEGSWVDARIDSADPGRKPLPKPSISSMHKALGPVAVFGASNFPLAFSVAGGDTASALGAGNPVIVKAHPAHPGTSALVGQAVRESVQASGLPEGVFSLLFDAGVEVGVQLVKHPAIKAVAFTGSFAGGTALMKLAAARPEPIPCYSEMGSVNPVFVLPGALKQRGAAVATGLQASFTLGGGQMCTKPGLVLVPRQDGTPAFLKELGDKVSTTPSQTLLTKAIADRYNSAVKGRTSDANVFAEGAIADDSAAATVQASLFVADYRDLMEHEDLAQEIFGPTTVVVGYQDRKQLLAVAEQLEGHLTATVHADESELADYADLIDILSRKAGRLILNGYPTGVEVCNAMVHGGPFPATSDGRSTSVGPQAIYRFTRLVCYQSFPDVALPDELKSTNPLGIMRMIDGDRTRKASA